MASSVSGQNEPNPALWLATRAGKMTVLPALSRKRHFPKSYVMNFSDQDSSVKMVGYWPHSFFVSLWSSIHKHVKRELGQYPAILTSCLVNNPHILNDLFNIVACTKQNSKVLLSYPSFLFQLSIITTPSLYMAKESQISRLWSRVHTSCKQFCQVKSKSEMSSVMSSFLSVWFELWTLFQWRQ